MRILAALFLIALSFGCSPEKSNLDKTIEGVASIENAKALESCIATAEGYSQLVSEQAEQIDQLMKDLDQDIAEMKDTMTILDHCINTLEDKNAALDQCADTLAEAVESLYECKGVPMPRTTVL